MKWGNWLKIIVLILLPINAWLSVFYYLNWQRKRDLQKEFSERVSEYTRLRVIFVQDRIKLGQRLHYPFPFRFIYFGNIPSIGKGFPILFVNISPIKELELWQPIIQEALNTSTLLHVILLFPLVDFKKDKESLKEIQRLMMQLQHPRLSGIAGPGVNTTFGGYPEGIFLVLCDGQGIVRAVEPFPKLKISPYWEEEIEDWRPKLHQAVKRALEKFYGKPSGTQGR
jgi:hypothetical protein